MLSKTPGKGAAYMIAFTDGAGTPLSGGSSYRLNLPANIPAADFWSVTLYEAENASGLANGQPFPSLGSRDKPLQNADGSTDLSSGQKHHRGKRPTGSLPCLVRDFRHHQAVRSDRGRHQQKLEAGRLRESGVNADYQLTAGCSERPRSGRSAISAEISKLVRMFAHYLRTEAPEKLRFGRLQLTNDRFSLSRIEPVPFVTRKRPIRQDIALPYSACKEGCAGWLSESAGTARVDSRTEAKPWRPHSACVVPFALSLPQE
jgi:hypothetical protein